MDVADYKEQSGTKGYSHFYFSLPWKKAYVHFYTEMRLPRLAHSNF